MTTSRPAFGATAPQIHPLRDTVPRPTARPEGGRPTAQLPCTGDASHGEDGQITRAPVTTCPGLGGSDAPGAARAAA